MRRTAFQGMWVPKQRTRRIGMTHTIYTTRFRPQFRLATLLALVAAVSVPLAFHAEREHKYGLRLAAVTVLSKAGDWVGIEGGFGSNRDVSVPVIGGAHGQVRPDGPFGLKRGEAVTSVYAGPSLSEEEVSAILCFPELRHLDLSGAGVRIETGPPGGNVYFQKPGVFDHQLREMVTLAAIEELNLCKTPLTNGGMRHVAELRTLRKLSVNSPSVTDDGIRHLARLWELVELDLSGTSITDEGVRSLVRLPSLRTLSLARTKVTGAELACLAAMAQLERLNLSDADVGDALLSQLARLPNLAILDLTGTRVTDKGLKQLPRCDALELLSLGGTGISDEGLESLTQCGALQDLCLSRCRGVSDASLPFLAQIKSLSRVRLDATSVTAGGAARLHELLPEAEIYWGPVDGRVESFLPNKAGAAGGGFF